MPRFEIRPLGPWIGPVTRNREPAGRFRADWESTVDLLLRETGQLGAKVITVQVDLQDGEIRRDGMLRSGARAKFPGVRVVFDSRHGLLTYASDTYDGWKANVRAIALALEALRAVDRYGVSKSGEQYRGWRAIEAGPAGPMSTDRAAALLAALGGGTPAELLADADARGRAFKRAARKYHPDRPDGDRGLFDQAVAARDLLDASAALTGGDTSA